MRCIDHTKSEERHSQPSNPVLRLRIQPSSCKQPHARPEEKHKYTFSYPNPISPAHPPSSGYRSNLIPRTSQVKLAPFAYCRRALPPSTSQSTLVSGNRRAAHPNRSSIVLHHAQHRGGRSFAKEGQGGVKNFQARNENKQKQHIHWDRIAQGKLTGRMDESGVSESPPPPPSPTTPLLRVSKLGCLRKTTQSARYNTINRPHARSSPPTKRKKYTGMVTRKKKKNMRK